MGSLNAGPLKFNVKDYIPAQFHIKQIVTPGPLKQSLSQCACPCHWNIPQVSTKIRQNSYLIEFSATFLFTGGNNYFIGLPYVEANPIYVKTMRAKVGSDLSRWNKVTAPHSFNTQAIPMYRHSISQFYPFPAETGTSQQNRL